MPEQQRYTVIMRTIIFVFRGDELLLIEFSGKGGHQDQEKTDRKGLFNAIGGHIEAGEDVIASARREAMEEAGITLVNPRIRGVINSGGLASKNIMNFIIMATTNDTRLKHSIEGKVQWVPLASVDSLNTYPDIRPFIDTLLSLKDDQMFVGTSQFEGFRLVDLQIRVV